MPSRSDSLVLVLVLVLVLPAFAQLPEPVSRCNQALDLLKTGQTDEAAQIFESLLDDNLADTLARRWLTRLDREQVKAQLQAVYRQHIAYPPSLPATTKPATDRWGKPWVYRPVDLQHVTGTKNQSFLLESPTLGTNSDLHAALKNLTAEFAWKIVGADAKVVTFSRPGNPQPVLLSAGTSLDGVTVVQIGEKEVLVGDGDRWLTLPIPKR
jgi:hypothetical protein